MTPRRTLDNLELMKDMVGRTRGHSISNDFIDNFSFNSTKYDTEDDNFDLKPSLTVEEIFAHGIHEWKRAREEVKSRRKAAGLPPPANHFLPHSMRGPLYDPNYDEGFDREVEELLAPNRRKLFHFVRKTSVERLSDVAEARAEEESSSLPGVRHLKNEKKRKSTTASLSETRDNTANDPDAKHK